MDYIEQFAGKFSLVAWAYHHGADSVIGHLERTAFYDLAQSLGVDVMIDFHNAVDEISLRGMKLIIQTTVSPDDPALPMGDVHWGGPTVDEPKEGWDAWNAVRGPVDGAGRLVSGKPWPKLSRPLHGNTAQLAWYEQHFGTHPAVVGYCLNDACTPCPENEVSARWLMENAPGKIRYVSYGQPKTQDGALFPVASFLNFSFAQDKTEDRSRHDCFVAIARSAKLLAEKQGCKLWWPIIPASCPNRYVAADEIQFQIERLQEAGADGVILFPWGTWFNEYVAGRENGHIGGVIAEAVLAAKSARASASVG